MHRVALHTFIGFVALTVLLSARAANLLNNGSWKDLSGGFVLN